MSLSLHYAVPPVELEVLGGLDEVYRYVLEALNVGHPFQQATLASLAADPVVLEVGDAPVLYLRGVLSGLVDSDSRDNDAATQLARLLAEIDRRGTIMIGATS